MDLGFDLAAAAQALCEADERLARVIELSGPCRLAPDAMESPFEALLRAIIYQQLSGKAAATIYSRVQALMPGQRRLKPELLLALPDDALRGAGVSRAKVAAAKDLAAKVLDGTVPKLARLREMDDEEIVERLVLVRGIGTWTAEMLLIFRLGRPDVLPAADLGVRKGFHKTFRTRGLPPITRVLKHGERWRPYRTVASWYLWRACDLNLG